MQSGSNSFFDFPRIWNDRLVWLYKRPVLKQHDGYIGMDLAIFNHSQMTRTTPELEFPSFRATPIGGCLAPYVCFNMQLAHIHGGSSVESSFEPSDPEAETLPLGHRSLPTLT
ncbi:hypothetical protein AVEN_203589-1 [Araneus ventricosus]|uniref:Uncharacterized protein n=1 Tax=Araneus ventricosus TaxID=182803 RepID=A0A4Y2ENE4_ARAVE|nr:hypothetical protein AVEN_203589-1 [Araneus ventricosus]